MTSSNNSSIEYSRTRIIKAVIVLSMRLLVMMTVAVGVSQGPENYNLQNPARTESTKTPRKKLSHR